jgi:hypothetical protein
MSARLAALLVCVLVGWFLVLRQTINEEAERREHFMAVCARKGGQWEREQFRCMKSLDTITVATP